MASLKLHVEGTTYMTYSHVKGILVNMGSIGSVGRVQVRVSELIKERDMRIIE